MIVDERGYVITNHHVVASAEHITVQLYDGTDLSPQIIKDDPRHDLAIRHQIEELLRRLLLHEGLQSLETDFDPPRDWQPLR